MLKLLGSSTLDKFKSAAIVVLLGLLSASLWQVSIEHDAAVKQRLDGAAAAGVARAFAIALTSYDYAHPEVQRRQLLTLSSTAVNQRVADAAVDLVVAKASSIGEVTETAVVTVGPVAAEVLVGTSQVVSGSYVAGTVALTGVLDIGLSPHAAGWIVTNYRWLASPSSAP